MAITTLVKYEVEIAGRKFKVKIDRQDGFYTEYHLFTIREEGPCAERHKYKEYDHLSQALEEAARQQRFYENEES